MAINIGSLFGGIIVPIVAQTNVAAAYTIPVCVLGLGLIVFVLGTPRYVRRKADKTVSWNTFKLVGSRIACKPFEAAKESNGGHLADSFVEGVKRLLCVIPITMLTVPFSIAYSQMSTVFIVQGTVMRNAGIIDASLMNNADAISVLVFGALIGSVLYPYLTRKGVTLAATTKFAIGTFVGALAIIAAIIVDMFIHKRYEAGQTVSVLWQAFSYVLIGAGEIFAIATSYDVAFTVAPSSQKGLASAINLFFVGAIPNFISIGLYQACAAWFPINTSLEAYAGSQVYSYLWILFGIAMAGVVVNLLPPVRKWVEKVRMDAQDASMHEQRNSSAGMEKNKDMETQETREESDTSSADSTESEGGEDMVDVDLH